MGIAYINSRSRGELADMIYTYWEAYRRHGYGNPDKLDIPVAFHVHVAEIREEAEANTRGPLDLYLKTRQYGRDIRFDDLKQREQVLVGSPEDVIRQIEAYHEIGITNLMALMNFGGMAHEKVCRSLELFGKHVIPAFKKQTGDDRRVRTYE
ncbi:hypothetical protein GCM10011571_34250 [Marinithermofilum abyssi]|uniref:Luciferase-like monooxygenase n=1 Tax=Marinithermofilum abyssi TaxID=1571185 RepID=A0A8J2VM16_9BACL|nr:LLM class flavin-dependent oxidoreductase [Marinithermofilum abyssi]GGE29271.1 hypothetical protein GCM10011571_34250 [Marinithermofilum abyssi]